MMLRISFAEGLVFFAVALVSGWVGVVAQSTYSTTDAAKCCKRKVNSTLPESKCSATQIKANAFQQIITTPGYPGPFPADVFCTWHVHAIPGRRIWLDFRNLHLVEKTDQGCEVQKLFIKSPLTGLSMGPYCGHDGLPNVVSTGNHLIVELQSPLPTADKFYKGFEMAYMETVQTTSPELRPSHWSEGLFMESESKPVTKPPRYKPPRRKNGSPKPKKPNSKPSLPNRVRAQTTTLRPYTPPRTYRPNHYTPKTIENESALSPEAIVGIVVGGIFMVAVISAVAAKLSLRREERRKKDEENRNRPDRPIRDSAQKRRSLPWAAAPLKSPYEKEAKRHPVRKATGYHHELSRVAYTSEENYKSKKGTKDLKPSEPRRGRSKSPSKRKKKPGTTERTQLKRDYSEKKGKHSAARSKNSEPSNNKSRRDNERRSKDKNFEHRKERKTDKKRSR